MHEREPIVKCRACKGEGIIDGPRACRRCGGTGLRAIQAIKTCGCCGIAYTSATWELLELVGYQEDEVERLELRNCRCGSTLAIAIERDEDERSVA